MSIAPPFVARGLSASLSKGLGMNPKLSGWRFPLRYSIKRIKIHILGVNTTLMVLVHPYNEKTEGGSLLQATARLNIVDDL